MSGERRKPRVVLDTNLVVSGLLLNRGIAHDLVRAWREREFFLLLSPMLQDEYARVLARPAFARKYGLTVDDVAAFMRLLALLAIKVAPHMAIPFTVRDPKDDMVLACALDGRADYLVTGDGDLLALRAERALGRLRIITAAEFLKALTTYTAGPRAYVELAQGDDD